MTVAPSTAAVADFRLTDEERMLREAVRDMLAAHWSPAVARTLAAEPTRLAVAWPAMAEWVGVVEAGAVASCIAAEEAGAALAPGELTAAWALAGLLGALEHPLADPALAGELGGTVAFAPDGASLVLRGAADGPVVALEDTMGAAALHPADSLVALASADLTRGFARFAAPGPGEPAGGTATALERWVGTAALLAGADALGACRTLLETTVSYARDRHQFGRPIGTFQAVRHRLVDLAVALERASAATFLAAMQLDAGAADATLSVHTARAASAEAVARLTRGAVQLHGAIGYTWDSDVHLYVRRAYVSDRLFGAGSWHRARLAEGALAGADDDLGAAW